MHEVQQNSTTIEILPLAPAYLITLSFAFKADSDDRPYGGWRQALRRTNSLLACQGFVVLSPKP